MINENGIEDYMESKLEDMEDSDLKDHLKKACEVTKEACPAKQFHSCMVSVALEMMASIDRLKSTVGSHLSDEILNDSP